MMDLSKNIWNLSLQQLKTLYLHYHNAYDNKFGRVVTCHKGLPHINSHDSLISWSFESTWQTKIIIFTGTKFGRVVTYLQKLLPIESHGSWVTWSCEITRQNKDFISPLPQCLRSPKFGRVTSYHEKLPVIKPQWLFDHVVFWDYMADLNHYILTTALPMARRVDRVVIYLEGLLPIKSHSFWVTWTCEIMWQIKNIAFPLQQCLWPLNLAGWSRTLRVATYKVTWSFDHMVLWDHVTS